MKRKQPLFHLSIPAADIPEMVKFYSEELGCPISIVEKKRCIIDFWGHQLVCHWTEKDIPEHVSMYPRHHGVIFDCLDEFEALYKLAKEKELPFFQELFTRFPNTPREHKTFFITDPSKNLLEFKWYKNKDLLFKCQDGIDQEPLHGE